MGLEKKKFGKVSNPEKPSADVYCASCTFPVRVWDWVGYQDDRWNRNIKYFEDHVQYGIWPNTFPELVIFPVLMGRLNRLGSTAIVSTDTFLEEKSPPMRGPKLNIEKCKDIFRCKQDDLVSIGELFSLKNPSFGDVLLFQNVSLSDKSISLDFYVDGDLCSDFPMLKSQDSRDYWENCVNSLILFGSTYIPLESDDDAQIVLFGRDAVAIDRFSDIVLDAFREISKIRSELADIDDSSLFLAKIDDLLASSFG